MVERLYVIVKRYRELNPRADVYTPLLTPQVTDILAIRNDAHFSFDKLVESAYLECSRLRERFPTEEYMITIKNPERTNTGCPVKSPVRGKITPLEEDYICTHQLRELQASEVLKAREGDFLWPTPNVKVNSVVRNYLVHYYGINFIAKVWSWINGKKLDPISQLTAYEIIRELTGKDFIELFDCEMDAFGG